MVLTGKVRHNLNNLDQLSLYAENPSELIKQNERAAAPKGSLNNTRETNAFIQSLRNYPKLSTKAISAELIQRLITYREAKNLTKSSFHMKSTHSSSEKKANTKTQIRTNASKNLQTYARMKRSRRDAGIITDKDIKFDDKMRETNRPHVNKLTRSKSSHLNYSYDYLKCSSLYRSANGRGSDVRYLTDIKRAIKNTVQKLFQDRPDEYICPKIKSRYSHHRRRHHKNCVDAEVSCCLNIGNCENTVTSSVMKEASMTTCCVVPTETRQLSCLLELELCCTCKKPLPCSCKVDLSKESTNDETNSGFRSKISEVKLKTAAQAIDRIKSTPMNSTQSNQVSQMYEDTFKNNAETIILDFIEKNCGDILTTKAINEEIIENFVKTITDIMLRFNNDKSTVNDEILRFINIIPVQSNISKEKLATQLISTLQNGYIYCSTPYKDRLQPQRVSLSTSISTIRFEDIDREEKYKRELTKIINDWANDLSADFNTMFSKRFRDTLTNDLVTNIIEKNKYLQSNTNAQLSKRDVLEQLKNRVLYWLNKLPDIGDLSSYMSKTEALINSINTIPVPLLVENTQQWNDVHFNKETSNTYKKILNDDVSFWLDDIPDDLFLNSFNKIHRDKIIHELAGRIQELENNGTSVREKIMNLLGKVTKCTDQNKLQKTTQELINRLSTTSCTDEANWINLHKTNENFDKKLTGAIITWLKDQSLYKARSSSERLTTEKIAADLAIDVMQTFDNMQTIDSNVNTDELFIKVAMKHFRRVPIHTELKTNESFINNISQELLQFLKVSQIFGKISKSTSLVEGIDNKIKDWLNSLPLVQTPGPTVNKQLSKLMKDFTASIKQFKHTHANDQIILEEILKFLKELPIDYDKKSNYQYMKQKPKELLNTLHSLEVNDNEQEHLRAFANIMSDIEFSFGPKVDSSRAADIYYETVNKWCESLPINSNDTPEEKNRVKVVKQNIVTKITNKLKELDMEPELIFDDVIYTELLENEIDNLLSFVSINTELVQCPKMLARNLVNQLKEVKYKTKIEVPGHTYKQQLREAISKTLPSDYSITEDNEAFLEVLKDDLADAFINLHYFGGQKYLRDKFKTKINEEIAKFCENYLKRQPSSPIDSLKLNKALYSALKNVSMPAEQSIRSEVEETRLKDEIHEWVKGIPLKIQNSRDKQYTKKLISIMAKRLHRIEKNIDIPPNHADKLKKEISKWVKRLPLESEAETKSEYFVDQLIEKLINTVAARQFNYTFIHSFEGETTNDSTISQKNFGQCSSFPPCTLNSEDRALLQRIRNRVSNDESGKKCHTDASIIPSHRNNNFEKEMRLSDSSTTDSCLEQHCSPKILSQVEKVSSIGPGNSEVDMKRSGCLSYSKHVHENTRLDCNPCERNHFDISPQVSFKEYSWNSTHESLLPRERQPCLSQGLKESSCLRQCSPCKIPSIPQPALQSCPSRQGSYYLPSPHVLPEEPCCQTQRSRFIQHNHRHESSSAIRRLCINGFDSFSVDKETDCQRLDYKCPIHFSEACDFGHPDCSRRIVPSDENKKRPCITELINKVERDMCRFWERPFIKCPEYKSESTSEIVENCLSKCHKCCGTHCPHPSSLYFKQ